MTADEIFGALAPAETPGEASAHPRRTPLARSIRALEAALVVLRRAEAGSAVVRQPRRRPPAGTPPSAHRSLVVEWLRSTLQAAGGARAGADIIDEGRLLGYSDRAMRDAARAMGVQRRGVGYPRVVVWCDPHDNGEHVTFGPPTDT